MVRRITEAPFIIGHTVTESGANTFTTASLELPVAPVIAKGRFQALELMAVDDFLDSADLESAQIDNTSRVQLVHAEESAMLQFDDDGVIWERRQRTGGVGTTVGAVTNEEVAYSDMTDHDGNGRLIADREIFLQIQGTGNAGAKRSGVKLIVHLVELDENDITSILLSRDDN